MEELKQLDEVLTKYVKLTSYPVAIKIIESEEEVPPRAKRPKRDFGHRITTCMAYNIARKYGWVIATFADDLDCIPGLFVVGMAEMPEYYLEGHACVNFYTKTLEAGKRTEAETPRLPVNTKRGLLFAPLFRCTFEPDLILIYGNGAQVNLLIAAALYHRGGRLHSTASGRLDCSDIIVQTLRDDECKFVIPCNGDRIFSMIDDHEIAFTIPKRRIPDIIEALPALYKNGVRYPVPKAIPQVKPVYPESYNKMIPMIGRDPEKDL